MMGDRISVEADATDDLYDRAECAESEYRDLVVEVKGYVEWLEQPHRGPVIYRSEVAGRLRQILAQ